MSAFSRWQGLRLSTRTAIVTAFVVAVIGAYSGAMLVQDRSPFLNLEVVEPGRLIRSAQPLPGDLELVRDRHGLGSILCLAHSEEDEVLEWALREGVPVLVMRMWADDPPTGEQVELFFRVIRGEAVNIDEYERTVTGHAGMGAASSARLPFPVLVHCEGGADRTGVMVALYRMVFQGWELSDAKLEMMSHFHIPFVHPAQFEFLEEAAEHIKSGRGVHGLEAPAPLPRAVLGEE